MIEHKFERLARKKLKPFLVVLLCYLVAGKEIICLGNLHSYMTRSLVLC